jgi:hypothetical protein
MLYLLIKAAVSGVIVAVVSETARRNPGLGAECQLTVACYAAVVAVGPRFGLRL